MGIDRRSILTALAGAAAFAPPVPSLAQGAGPAVLRIATPTNMNTLDPAKTRVADEYNVTFLLFSGLTQIDVTGALQPDLAESWSPSDDLKTWTFHLRPGVKFHHGRTLDSTDVKATVERILDPSTGSTARGNFQIVEAIETPDPLTIRFRLSIPYSDFPGIFGDRQAKIVPRDLVDTLASQPVGTGPFRFRSFTPGDRVELVRNPDYYVPGEPMLDGVVFRIMPETAARVAALNTGEIDLVWDVPPEALDQLRRNRNIVVDSVPTSSWDGVAMNCEQKPLDDPRVRRAMLAAVDKRALVDVAMFGNATPTHIMIPPSSPYFDKGFPIGAPDIALAKRLLAEAGHANGFTMTCYVPVGRPSRERIGVALREFLQPVGINIDIQRMPQDRFVREIEGKAPLYVVGYYSRATLDLSLYPFLHSKGTWNSVLWHYKNPQVDQILDTLRTTRDAGAMSALYNSLQQAAIEDPPGIIPYVQNHANAYKRSVVGFKTSPLMWLDVRRTRFGQS